MLSVGSGLYQQAELCTESFPHVITMSLKATEGSRKQLFKSHKLTAGFTWGFSKLSLTEEQKLGLSSNSFSI